MKDLSTDKYHQISFHKNVFKENLCRYSIGRGTTVLSLKSAAEIDCIAYLKKYSPGVPQELI